MHLLLRYAQALITQVEQTAVCNRLHSLDHQLCRWLLMSLDRLQGNDIVMTQERIADLLGVRRVSVTKVAFELQDAGLIRYRRGHISQCWIATGWSVAPASVTRWSRKNVTVCLPARWPRNAAHLV